MACFRLLTADMGHLTKRLMAMRLAAEATDVNLLKIVESHPSLLLHQTFTLDQQVVLPFHVLLFNLDSDFLAPTVLLFIGA